jgi:3-hydroxyisobutyrate dehydrogenase-like beta-hydroxyacid dehydrogenase
MSAPAEAVPAPSTTIGFVGLGNMGLPIAERLQAAGRPLVVYNRTRSKAEPALSAGAKWAFSAADVGRAATSGIVFTSLSDARAGERVLLGPKGLAAGLAAGSLIIDLSTIGPAESRSFAERLGAKGIHYVDAPVGGSVEAARNGKLLVFVGGSNEDVERARPFLATFGRRIEHLGPVGSGTSMKLVNNLATLTYLAGAAEALSLAEGLGLDRHRTIDLLLDGTGYSRLLELKRSALEERKYPAHFELRLAKKDLGLITRAAKSTGRDARLARETERLATEGVRAGHGHDDYTAIFESALARRVRTPAPGPAPPPDSSTSA